MVSKDTRVPTSVTVKGKYTVKIYDEQAYKKNIEQYATIKQPCTPATDKPHNIQPFVKRKRIGSYNWTSPLDSKGA